MTQQTNNTENPTGFWRLTHDQVTDLAQNDLLNADARVFLVIADETLGWGRPAGEVPLSVIEERTGMDRSHVTRAIRRLREQGRYTETRLSYGRVQRSVIWPNRAIRVVNGAICVQPEIGPSVSQIGPSVSPDRANCVANTTQMAPFKKGEDRREEGEGEEVAALPAASPLTFPADGNDGNSELTTTIPTADDRQTGPSNIPTAQEAEVDNQPRESRKSKASRAKGEQKPDRAKPKPEPLSDEQRQWVTFSSATVAAYLGYGRAAIGATSLADCSALSPTPLCWWQDQHAARLEPEWHPLSLPPGPAASEQQVAAYAWVALCHLRSQLGLPLDLAPRSIYNGQMLGNLIADRGIQGAVQHIDRIWQSWPAIQEALRFLSEPLVPTEGLYRHKLVSQQADIIRDRQAVTLN